MFLFLLALGMSLEDSMEDSKKERKSIGLPDVLPFFW